MNNNSKLKKIKDLKQDILNVKSTLLQYADDKEQLIRSKALETLSTFYDGDIDRKILSRLNDKDSLVKVSALEAISLPRNIENVFNKIAKLLKDKDWLVQAYAINALADNNAKKYHIKIKKLLKTDKNDEVLVRIYYALVIFGEKKYFIKLLKMLKHKNYTVRCATASFLYYLENDSNHKQIIRKLKKALNSEKTKAAKSCIKGTLQDITQKTKGTNERNRKKKFKKASDFLEKGKMKKALKLFLMLSKEGDSYVDLNIAYIYERIGKAKKAKKLYKKLINETKDTNAMVNLGILYRENYENRKAKKWFLQAVLLNDGDAAFELGKIFLCEANLKESLKYFDIAMKSEYVCKLTIEEAKNLYEKIKKI